MAKIRKAFPELRSVEGGSNTIEVIVVGADAAFATESFQEIVTDGAGRRDRVRGAASWLCRRIDGQWRIVHHHEGIVPTGAPPITEPKRT